MEKNSLGSKSIVLIRSLLISYVVTALLLLLMALLLFKLELNENKISMGMIAVYALSCFLGGLSAGKGGRNRRFLWGLATGALYFIILLAVSLGMGGERESMLSLVTTGALCLGGGMIGGMLA